MEKANSIADLYRILEDSRGARCAGALTAYKWASYIYPYVVCFPFAVSNTAIEDRGAFEHYLLAVAEDACAMLDEANQLGLDPMNLFWQTEKVTMLIEAIEEQLSRNSI